VIIKTRRRRKKSYLPFIAIGMAILLLIYYWIGEFPSKTTANNLAEAIQKYEKQDYAGARVLLEDLTTDSGFANWALLYLAKSYEAESELNLALKYYEKIAKDSPASLDAQIAKLKLEIQLNRSSDSLGFNFENLNELSQKLKRYVRKDLEIELEYLKAYLEELDGNIPLAKVAYQKLRVDAVNTDVGNKAILAVERIKHQFPDSFLSLAALIEETHILLKEKRPLLALESIQKAKVQTTEGSPAYYETILVEEEVLRNLSRPLEADNVLAIVMAEGPAGVADKAQAKIIKNLWNQNKQEQALELIERFLQRFPTSNEKNDVRYIQARVEEELSHHVSARKIYLDLADSFTAPDQRLSSLRRAAWSYYLEGDLVDSFKIFKRITKLAAELVAAPDLNFSLVKTIRDEENLASFWMAYALSKMDADLRTENQFSENPKTLFRELASKDFFGYYGLLASHYLDDNPATYQANSSQTSIANCQDTIDENLNTRLENLAKSNLSGIVKNEIYWHFPFEEPQSPPPSFFAQTNLRIKLFNDYANTAQGITSALYHLTKYQQVLNDEPLLTKCKLRLFDLAYPVTYQPFYEKAALSNSISEPFLLAITHTESRFDPNAVSIKNAQGLMQLLPSTAKEVGLSDNDSLFNPNTNINLGAKQLAKLLNQYKQETNLAIAAYNAGSSAVKRWIDRYPKLEPVAWIETISYPETKDYVKKVLLAKSIYEHKLSQSERRNSDN
jgi:soluble lytic murein transglycosylase